MQATLGLNKKNRLRAVFLMVAAALEAVQKE
jgi:hypothetical protein